MRLKVNGRAFDIDADPDTPLLWALRDLLNLTGTKFGCGVALCGACTVHVGGVPRRACVTPIEAVGEAEVVTIEALGSSRIGAALQKAWLDQEVVQCGYCQSGQLMQAAALIAATPRPADGDIDQVMAGNICRCGTYGRIRAAIKQASAELAGPGGA